MSGIYKNIQTDEVLDIAILEGLKDNAMLKVTPELWIEWNFKKNDELGLNVFEVTKGSGVKSWWVCRECKSPYDSIIGDKKNGKGCPYCTGRKVNHTNSLANLRPDLAEQWHYEKNGDLTPHDVTCSKGLKVSWKCEKAHEWKATINNRSKDKGCPYCSGRMAWRGESDIWTTNPKLASMLSNHEDGYKYTQNSNQKVDWKCPNCNNIVKNKQINKVNVYGLSCHCSDGISYNEKFFSSFLKQLNIVFETQKTYKWSQSKKYDFYIEDFNMIIETHGGQHYGKGFENMGGRTLVEEQANDIYKKELAISNGISKYASLDCRKSELEWIKDSILNSELADLYDLSNVDWAECERKALKSLVVEVCELWNSGIKNTKEIADMFNTTRVTIVTYLKKGTKIGLCDYDGNIERNKKTKRQSKKVVQLTLGGEYVKSFNSLKEAERITKINCSTISKVCRSVGTTAGGFKWKYVD